MLFEKRVVSLIKHYTFISFDLSNLKNLSPLSVLTMMFEVTFFEPHEHVFLMNAVLYEIRKDKNLNGALSRR